jgi:hypothetical protein
MGNPFSGTVFTTIRTMLGAIVLIGFFLFTAPAGASQSWRAYFARCSPVLVNQWNPINNRLDAATTPSKWNRSAVLSDLHLFLALAGREGSCASSPERILNRDVRALSTEVAATMIVGEEWLHRQGSESSFAAGLRQMYSLNRKMANQFGFDIGRYEVG